MVEKTMDKIVNLCKNRGFVYPGSEIYGGLANSWDFGPLGSELKKNIRDAWWQKFVKENKYNVGIDAAIMMNPQVWVTTGHVGGFSDPLIDCKACKTRHRADKLIEEWSFKKGEQISGLDGWSNEELVKFINDNKIPCPDCGKTDFTDIRKFNLMFKTFMGVTEDAKSEVYLRPETAQGMFVNFKNVLRTTRSKMPMGICQIGRSFRNEITPGNFTFRTIEFEQMEYQTFCKEGNDQELYEFFKDYGKKFFEYLGLPSNKLRFHDHEKLAHYAKAACDIEYLFPFGWGEINGTHNRTNFDLTRHEEYSGESQHYLDPETNEKYIPFIIESTYGLDRTILAILFEHYHKETLENGEEREVLKLPNFLAPYKACVLPLVKKYHSEKASEVYEKLSKCLMCTYDETGSIGKRYRRQDVIGTPFCITIDDETINNNTVTIRDRDTMKQETINLDDLEKYIEDRVKF